MVIDGSYISFEDILAVAKDGIPVSISKSKAFVKRMAQTQTALMDAMQKGVAVYGVNTGYGKSCGNRISMKTALKNGANIFRFHGCGTGDPIGIEETRAAMLTRIICLARGYSGVSIGLLQQMAEFLNAGITPVVPAEGSVGASGDLTPMSYIGAALAGERDVFYRRRHHAVFKSHEKSRIKAL
ncbi:MAG: aromatic amino acid ammonia-lyase [Desulfobacterales bacterium]|nr:aromatic amino acid ammonia-lyase [Desulfobacterales bacterium]